MLQHASKTSKLGEKNSKDGDGKEKSLSKLKKEEKEKEKKEKKPSSFSKFGAGGRGEKGKKDRHDKTPHNPKTKTDGIEIGTHHKNIDHVQKAITQSAPTISSATINTTDLSEQKSLTDTSMQNTDSGVVEVPREDVTATESENQTESLIIGGGDDNFKTEGSTVDNGTEPFVGIVVSELGEVDNNTNEVSNSDNREGGGDNNIVTAIVVNADTNGTSSQREEEESDSVNEENLTDEELIKREMARIERELDVV
jgi:hypothetical protein